MQRRLYLQHDLYSKDSCEGNVNVTKYLQRATVRRLTTAWGGGSVVEHRPVVRTSVRC